MKVIYNILITVAVFLPATVQIGAQCASDSVYTLSQCKSMALANNADIRVADNNLRAAIETRKEAFTKYFPEISAGASAFKTHNDVIEYNVLDMFTLGIVDKGKAAGIWALQPTDCKR